MGFLTKATKQLDKKRRFDMYQVMTGLIWIVIVVVGVFAFLHFTGQDDIASEAGTAIVRRVGGTAATPKAAHKQKKDSDAQAVEDRLGWDIREIRGKEVAKVREGLEKINDFIYELEEKLSVDVDVVTEETLRKAKASRLEKDRLKEQIKLALEVRNNPNAVYPVKIKGITYANRNELEKALVPTIARYKALDKSYANDANAGAKGERMRQSVSRQLAIAKQTREILKSKLGLAEMTELGYKVEDNEGELIKLEAAATTILGTKAQELTGEATTDGELLDEMLDGMELETP